MRTYDLGEGIPTDLIGPFNLEGGVAKGPADLVMERADELDPSGYVPIDRVDEWESRQSRDSWVNPNDGRRWSR